MLFAAVGDFIRTEQELAEATPSRRDGIDEAAEDELRFAGAQLIQQACVLLRLPQAAACTGQVLFQRFYCKRSFRDFNGQARCPRRAATRRRARALARRLPSAAAAPAAAARRLPPAPCARLRRPCSPPLPAVRGHRAHAAGRAAKKKPPLPPSSPRRR